MSLRAFSKVQIILVCSVGQIISKRRAGYTHGFALWLYVYASIRARLGASPRRLASVIVGCSNRPYSRTPDPLGSLTFCSLADAIWLMAP